MENLDGFSIKRAVKLLAVWPKQEVTTLSKGVPQPIAAAILEADANLVDGRWNSAASAYRTTIERALKTLEPEAKGSLYSRIEAMQGKLPTELIGLLHEVRFLGNESVHGLVDPEPSDVKLGQRFTHLFLTYVFELPFQITEARSKRGALPP